MNVNKRKWSKRGNWKRKCILIWWFKWV